MCDGKNRTLVCSVVAAVLWAHTAIGLAQDVRPTVNTLFGPRAIGVSINPGTRAFNGGVSTSAGGGFLGLGGTGGAAFNPPRVRPASIATAATSPSVQVRTGLGTQLQPGVVELPQNAAEVSPAGAVAADIATQPASQDIADPAAALSTPLASPPPRIRYAAGGSQTGTASPASATRLADLIQRNPHVKSRSPITVSVRSGTTILSGRVATERDKRVAEMLARLEPGVGRVQNDLTVESPAAPLPPSTPGR